MTSLYESKNLQKKGSTKFPLIELSFEMNNIWKIKNTFVDMAFTHHRNSTNGNNNLHSITTDIVYNQDGFKIVVVVNY